VGKERDREEDREWRGIMGREMGVCSITTSCERYCVTGIVLDCMGCTIAYICMLHVFFVA